MSVRLNGKDISFGGIKKIRHNGSTVYQEVSGVIFSEDSWDNIVSNCNALEAGTITTTEFCGKYLKDDGSTITSMDDFIGLTHSLSINGVDHNVRVIGTQHDTISGGSTKAALTFQLVELLSDSSGTRISQKFNASASSLYYNIWNDGSQSCDIRNYLRGTFKGYLPDKVQNGIKTVKKKTSAGNTSTTVNELDESIFLLSIHEMGSATGISTSSYSHLSNYASTYNQEGEQYKYYQSNLGDSDPSGWNSESYKNITIKKSTGGTAYYYWLRSPLVDGSSGAWTVDSNGSVDGNFVINGFGVVPAFAI